MERVEQGEAAHGLCTGGRIGDVGKGAHRVSSCLPCPFSAHRQAVDALILGQAGDRYADRGDDGGHVHGHANDRGSDHDYAAGQSWQDGMPVQK